MALKFNTSDIIYGGLIYAAGDGIAALISDEFTWLRFGGILFIGASLYALEIPNYFDWIERKTAGEGRMKSAINHTLLATLYFNPLWIARHILFIKLLMGQYDQVNWGLLLIGLISFVVNVPVSLIGNYVIQNKISLKRRFLASSIFSGLLAIYFSLSATWFG